MSAAACCGESRRSCPDPRDARHRPVHDVGDHDSLQARIFSAIHNPHGVQSVEVLDTARQLQGDDGRHLRRGVLGTLGVVGPGAQAACEAMSADGLVEVVNARGGKFPRPEARWLSWLPSLPWLPWRFEAEAVGRRARCLLRRGPGRLPGAVEGS